MRVLHHTRPASSGYKNSEPKEKFKIFVRFAENFLISFSNLVFLNQARIMQIRLASFRCSDSKTREKYNNLHLTR